MTTTKNTLILGEPMRELEEIISSLPPERVQQIHQHTAELIAKEKARIAAIKKAASRTRIEADLAFRAARREHAFRLRTEWKKRFSEMGRRLGITSQSAKWLAIQFCRLELELSYTESYKLIEKPYHYSR